MLEKVSVVDKIEVVENGSVQVRTATRIVEDGTVISTNYHRHVLSPADDLTGQDARVVAIAQATWTPEVIAAYQSIQQGE
jgi:archaellum component FlaF (FlaF/FlaG flagellin family)